MCEEAMEADAHADANQRDGHHRRNNELDQAWELACQQ
eukprot:CAMPEP_0119116226 /NCGR_PEP_ID=MMETSP1180-20130426/52168_1 /TAXON_ID=3052 ORGANISM="Chlamydomonas cf sp, Strain CCMP681" /NCGR_SAMPLE_ID=MMETSP1180 /ASSEMBLY_ACC=CAM_ASM_000741 /LENGTH=37 /DNA_ID= /DNA_START= /DNA_END= /DNA_ORIENTATION=